MYASSRRDPVQLLSALRRRSRIAHAEAPRARSPRLHALRVIFYQDPKVAVGTILQNEDNHILLLRRAIEPGYGKWVFPGGFVDRGEEVMVAAVREAREEAGLHVRLDRLLNVYSYAGRAPVIIVYVASIIGGTLVIDDESTEARFFPPDDIPWDELAFRSTLEALREFLGRA